VKVFLTTTAAVLALAAPTWAASFSELDANGDGMVTLDEVEAVHSDVTAEAFAAMDTNMDGVLDEAEVSAAQEAGLLPQSDS
tara:strand:+ start:78 stop:323 length:246 start_codon:yes stop_codon:yes gene_type:complete